MSDIVVPVALLETLARQLLDHVREVHGDVVSLDAEYFWSVPPDARYGPFDHPPELTIGSLRDDLDALRHMAEDPDDTIGYGLAWLGNVVQAVAAEVTG